MIYHDVPAGLTIQVGRQDEPLDVSATFYDQSWKVGLHSFMDGVSAVKKLGSGTIQGYLFSEDEYRLDTAVDANRASRSGVYALRGTYSAGKPATVGLMYVRYSSSSINQANGIPSTNNGEIDLVSHFGSLQLTEEYSRSDAATRHDLTYIGAKVTLTPRDSITAFNYHIGDNADIGQDSAYPNGYQGNRYFYEHFFSKNLEIIPFYESDRQLYGKGRDTSTWVTLQYTY